MTQAPLDLDFWRGRRVFVTGHTGFKGSWLCIVLRQLGARVAGYALPPPTQPSLYALAHVDAIVDSTIADLRDLDRLVAALSAFAPDVVLHMAAQSVVLRSYDDPVETYATNVLGTVHLLEAVRRSKRACSVVNVTTDKCYENMRWTWGYRETDKLGGRDPYSNSKACAELVAQAYRESFFPASELGTHGVGLASARAGNVIGGGDWTPRQLVPEAVAAFARGEPVALRHPSATRPWQHVLDCLVGYLRLAEALAKEPARFGGEWNFGPADSDSRPVASIVEGLARRWSVAPAWVSDGAAHAPEEPQLRLDVSKAADLLGWRARLPIDVALAWVADWYRPFQAGADARGLCEAQVARYLAGDAAS